MGQSHPGTHTKGQKVSLQVRGLPPQLMHPLYKNPLEHSGTAHEIKQCDILARKTALYRPARTDLPGGLVGAGVEQFFTQRPPIAFRTVPGGHVHPGVQTSGHMRGRGFLHVIGMPPQGRQLEYTKPLGQFAALLRIGDW